MLLFSVSLVSLLLVILGRLIFGHWNNHVVLYFAVWGMSLWLFETRLFNYYPLEFGTWLVIIVASGAFLLGSVTPRAAAFAVAGSKPSLPDHYLPDSPPVTMRRERLMYRTLWITNVVSFCAALQHWYIVIKKFGSVMNALILGNLLYSYRVSEGLPGSIPYLHSLALTGCAVAGIYTAQKGSLKFIAVVPMIVMVMVEAANMGRANLVIAASLFVGAYLLQRMRMPPRENSAPRGMVKRLVAVTTVVLIMALGAEFVRTTRGANEKLPYESQSLKELQGASFVTPSIYLYLTVHFGVLNQYLLQDAEHTPWGSNTFAPLYRILSKLGFNTPAFWYQKFYETPIRANTGTYLREIHADFGVFGILIVPYLLGLSATLAWHRWIARGRYGALMAVVYLYAIVTMSIFTIATRSGELLISFVPAALVGALLDKA